MNTIVDEKVIPFKELEVKIFDCVCELGRRLTQNILEAYDTDLGKNRDKSKLRNKGTRRTTIKTVYGEVEYHRTVYQSKDPYIDVITHHLPMLDALQTESRKIFRKVFA